MADLLSATVKVEVENSTYYKLAATGVAIIVLFFVFQKVSQSV